MALATAGAALSVAAGVLTAGNTVASDPRPDLLGIAAIITAVASMIGTIGALWVQRSRRQRDPEPAPPSAEDLADALLRKIQREADRDD